MHTSTKLYIGGVLAGAIAIYVMITEVSFSSILTVFSRTELWLILGYLFVSMGVWFLHSLRWQVILDSHGVQVPWYRTFFYRMFGNSISYITPSARIGGELVRLAMLKRHNQSTKVNLSSIIIDKTLELGTNGVFFCVGIGIMLFTTHLNIHAFVTMLIILIIFSFTILMYYYHMLKGKSFLPKVCTILGLSKIKSVKKAMKKVVALEKQMIGFYKGSRNTFFISIIMCAGAWLLMIVEFYALLIMVGINPTLVEIFLVFSFVGLAYVFPLPMAVGSLEAAMLWIFSILGWPAAAALGVALVIRLRDTLIALAGLMGLSGYGFRLGKF
ncbi:flippase-like domain-containing protein, partial [Candidatus Woesearchaeota archaeon]|nr:flippase-like domain-containing protein [Candidatus Woesearchaeota archaeon]